MKFPHLTIEQGTVVNEALTMMRDADIKYVTFVIGEGERAVIVSNIFLPEAITIVEEGLRAAKEEAAKKEDHYDA